MTKVAGLPQTPTRYDTGELKRRKLFLFPFDMALAVYGQNGTFLFHDIPIACLVICS